MRKAIAIVLTLAFCLSSLSFVFAENDDQLQNGQLAVDELGYWAVNGTGYVYSEAPFENYRAEDKGLIPYSQQGLYTNPSWWAKSEVLEASKMGLNNMNVITNYQGDITRKEFCQLVITAFEKYSETSNKQLPSTMTNYFTDVSDEYVTKAYYLEIVQGRGNNKFDPDSNITRQEMALMIKRYLNLYYPNLNAENDIDSRFTDTNDISIWARKECILLGNLEIFKGDNLSRFLPMDNTTNEQALLLMLRVAKRFNDEQVANYLEAPTATYNENKDNTTITWNPISSATTYRVAVYEYQSKTEYNLVEQEFVNTTSIDLEGLKSGSYKVAITAMNEFQTSVEGESVYIYVPEDVEVDQEADGVLNFNTVGYKLLPDWTFSTDDIKYGIIITDENGDVEINKDNLSGTYTLTDDVLENIEDYTINVYASWFGFDSANTEITISTDDDTDSTNGTNDTDGTGE